MNKLAVITPIVLQTEAMLNIYIANLATYDVNLTDKIYLLCNRLSIEANCLASLLVKYTSIPIEIITDKERSVAGAWNRGIRLAHEAGYKLFHILAADTALHPNCQQTLVSRISDADLCSSIDFKSSYGDMSDTPNKLDFSSVIFKEETFRKYGFFDREYKPAYFEDNDYMARLHIKKGRAVGVQSALHYHYGSATINVDNEMAHHVRHWFEANRERFIAKWGARPEDTEKYLLTPYNSGKDVSWYPELDRTNYEVDGGMHE